MAAASADSYATFSLIDQTERTSLASARWISASRMSVAGVPGYEDAKRTPASKAAHATASSPLISFRAETTDCSGVVERDSTRADVPMTHSPVVNRLTKQVRNCFLHYQACRARRYEPSLIAPHWAHNQDRILDPAPG